MRTLLRYSTAAVVAGVAVALTAARPAAPRATDVDARGMRVGAAPLQSAAEMTFGPDGTLFVADSRGYALYALDVGDTPTRGSTERFQIADLDRKVAAALGTTVDELRFNDMAAHPASRNVYLAVTRGRGAQAVPALVRVGLDGSVTVLDLGHIKFATTPLPAAPVRNDTTDFGQPKWMLSVTDLAFVDGQLWVAGLSNEQFSSALRRVPFPFNKPAALTTVEIYHTSHDRYETEAPITAFVPLTVEGTPMVLAGYMCSPIATFRRAELASQHHLRGRTVAEMGGGSRPIDMIRYEQGGRQHVLIASNNRTLIRFDADSLAEAPAMTKPVAHAYQPGGVSYLPVASSGVMQLDDFGPQAVLLLRRDIDTGRVLLEAQSKEWL